MNWLGEALRALFRSTVDEPLPRLFMDLLEKLG